jgi:hypothetical protein
MAGTVAEAPPGRTRLLLSMLVFGDREARRHRTGTLRRWHELGWQTWVWTRWSLLGVSGARVPLFPSRLDLLDAAARESPPGGLWLEFGVFRGESINRLARHRADAVVGFDSFVGLPEKYGGNLGRGAFSLEGRLPPVASNVQLVKGWFAETLPRFLAEHPEAAVSLLHVDSDLYESARLVMEQLGSRLGPGSVIVFDEFVGWLDNSEYRAFFEFQRASGLGHRYIGCSPSGSVALQLTA